MQMQCNAMQCNAMQCNAMQCNAMQCNAMQCNAMQCNEFNFQVKIFGKNCKLNVKNIVGTFVLLKNAILLKV
jgi:hypothetical protein